MTKKEYENFLIGHEAFMSLSKEIKVEFLSYEKQILKVLNITTNQVQTFEILNGKYFIENKEKFPTTYSLAFKANNIVWALVLI